MPRGTPISSRQATGLLLYRNYLAYRRGWYIFVSGFLEPVLYLFSIGVGVGALISGFEFNGQTIPYAEFVAPGMLAASAMNGTLMDATFNFFFKLKYNKLFDQMLATPLTTMDIARGELSWSLLRGGIYAAAFLVIMVAMDLVSSWWAVLVVPGGAADRARVRRRVHGADDVHAVLAGLRVRHPRDDADVPLLGDVLPDHRLPRRAALGRRVHPALPRAWCSSAS